MRVGNLKSPWQQGHAETLSRAAKSIIIDEAIKSMAEQILAKSGLFFDEVNKIRVVNPQTAHNCAELKQDCNDFVSKITQFQRAVDGYIALVQQLSKEVEKEKIQAIGLRNLRQSVEKQKEMELHQLRSLIREKQIQLERLRIQYESLGKEEAEQREIIMHLIVPK